MKTIVWITVPLLSIGGCSFIQGPEASDNFLATFPGENYAITADLFDTWDMPLDTLTCSSYLRFLKEREIASAPEKVLVRTVQGADQVCFRTRKNGFFILLYFRESGIIIGDNSRTPGMDTMIHLRENEPVPRLEDIASRMKF